MEKKQAALAFQSKTKVTVVALFLAMVLLFCGCVVMEQPTPGEEYAVTDDAVKAAIFSVTVYKGNGMGTYTNRDIQSVADLEEEWKYWSYPVDPEDLAQVTGSDGSVYNIKNIRIETRNAKFTDSDNYSVQVLFIADLPRLSPGVTYDVVFPAGSVRHDKISETELYPDRPIIGGSFSTKELPQTEAYTPSFQHDVLQDADTGVCVTSDRIDAAATRLRVVSNGLHAAGKCEACDAIRARTDVIAVYNISMTGYHAGPVSVK